MAPETDLTETERDALRDLEHAVEHLHRAFGALLECHHETGHAMDQLRDAEESLREAGHESFADHIRSELLPTGVVDDRWTYEVVDSYRDSPLGEVSAFDEDVRERLADGTPHLDESALQERWRERANRR